MISNPYTVLTFVPGGCFLKRRCYNEVVVVYPCWKTTPYRRLSPPVTPLPTLPTEIFSVRMQEYRFLPRYIYRIE